MKIAFNTTADIFRLEAQGTTTEIYATLSLAVNCVIFPLEESYGEDLEGSYGKDYLMFTEETDIKQEDKIREGGNEYLVRGVEDYEFGAFRFLRLRIRKCQ